MVRLKNKVEQISLYLVKDFNNRTTTRLFFCGLVLLTLVKILTAWSFSRIVMSHHNISLPRSWFGKIILAPSFLANEHIDAFYGIAIVFLVVAFIVDLHYLTTIPFFWLTFNLYIINLPFANGADLVLFMLALWCILLPANPKFKSETGRIIQKASHNTGIILCQLQVVLIYFISGWDKLLSHTWRSGVAFDYIIHLDTMFNPFLFGVFDNPTTQLVLSWTTILFELAFVALVWIERSRILILAAGVFFHLFIWIVVSLPDFAMVMVVSYIVFLKDSDYVYVRRLFKR